MNRPCPKCHHINKSGNAFCPICGTALPPATSSSAKLALLVLGVIFGLCVLCGVIGSLNNHRTQRATATPAPTPVPSPPPPSAAEIVAKAKSGLNGVPSDTYVEQLISELKSIPPDAREHKEAQALLKRAEPLLKKAQALKAKEAADAATLGPKPENSAWDSSVRCVDRYLKQTLNDYDDSEYLEWSPVIKMDTKEGPYWVVRLKLRARNAFGGKIIKEVLFFIRNNQVVKHSDL